MASAKQQANRRKDLEMVFNLQWKDKSVNDYGDVVGMYDIPNTTLRWECFKSYLFKNSGMTGDEADVKISYLDVTTDSYTSITCQRDFQLALYVFRQHARVDEIIHLRLQRSKDRKLSTNALFKALVSDSGTFDIDVTDSDLVSPPTPPPPVDIKKTDEIKKKISALASKSNDLRWLVDQQQSVQNDKSRHVKSPITVKPGDTTDTEPLLKEKSPTVELTTDKLVKPCCLFPKFVPTTETKNIADKSTVVDVVDDKKTGAIKKTKESGLKLTKKIKKSDKVKLAVDDVNFATKVKRIRMIPKVVKENLVQSDVVVDEEKIANEKPPEWFNKYMKKFKHDLLQEITILNATQIETNMKKMQAITAPVCLKRRQPKTDHYKRRCKISFPTTETTSNEKEPSNTTDYLTQSKFDSAGVLKQPITQQTSKVLVPTYKLKAKRSSVLRGARGPENTTKSGIEILNALAPIKHADKLNKAARSFNNNANNRRPSDECQIFTAKKSSGVEEGFNLRAFISASVVGKQVVTVTNVTAGDTYLQRWSVVNSGDIPWTKHTELRYTWGSQCLIPVDEKVACPLLNPGVCGTVAVLLHIPETPGTYESYWHFHHHGERFGHWLGCRVIVTKPANITTPLIKMPPPKYDIINIDDQYEVVLASSMAKRFRSANSDTDLDERKFLAAPDRHIRYVRITADDFKQLEAQHAEKQDDTLIFKGLSCTSTNPNRPILNNSQLEQLKTTSAAKEVLRADPYALDALKLTPKQLEESLAKKNQTETSVGVASSELEEFRMTLDQLDRMHLPVDDLEKLRLFAKNIKPIYHRSTSECNSLTNNYSASERSTTKPYCPTRDCPDNDSDNYSADSDSDLEVDTEEKFAYNKLTTDCNKTETVEENLEQLQENLTDLQLTEGQAASDTDNQSIVSIADSNNSSDCSNTASDSSDSEFVVIPMPKSDDERLLSDNECFGDNNEDNSSYVLADNHADDIVVNNDNVSRDDGDVVGNNAVNVRDHSDGDIVGNNACVVGNNDDIEMGVVAECENDLNVDCSDDSSSTMEVNVFVYRSDSDGDRVVNSVGAIRVVSNEKLGLSSVDVEQEGPVDLSTRSEVSYDTMATISSNSGEGSLPECSTLGTLCSNVIRNTQAKQGRLFVFPKDCPGFEVVYPDNSQASCQSPAKPLNNILDDEIKRNVKTDEQKSHYQLSTPLTTAEKPLQNYVEQTYNSHTASQTPFMSSLFEYESLTQSQTNNVPILKLSPRSLQISTSSDRFESATQDSLNLLSSSLSPINTPTLLPSVTTTISGSTTSNYTDNTVITATVLPQTGSSVSSSTVLPSSTNDTGNVMYVTRQVTGGIGNIARNTVRTVSGFLTGSNTNSGNVARAIGENPTIPTAPPTPDVSPQQFGDNYAENSRILCAMGFHNVDLNMQLLVMHANDIQTVIANLLPDSSTF